MLPNSYISPVKVINSRAMLGFCCQIEFSLDQLKGSLRTSPLIAPTTLSGRCSHNLQSNLTGNCQRIAPLRMCIFVLSTRILVPRAHDPFGQRRGSICSAVQKDRGLWGREWSTRFSNGKKMAVQGGTLVLLLAGYFL